MSFLASFPSFSEEFTSKECFETHRRCIASSPAYAVSTPDHHEGSFLPHEALALAPAPGPRLLAVAPAELVLLLLTHEVHA